MKDEHPPLPKVRFYRWDTKPVVEPFSEAYANSPCDRFPLSIFDSVQVVLKTGLTEPPDRLRTHLDTVTKCIPNLLIVSDHDGKINQHVVYDVLADLPETYVLDNPDFETYRAQNAMLQNGNITSYSTEGGWKLDRFKFLPMIHKAYTMRSAAQWYVFIETDTYIFWDNLFRMLSQLSPLVPLYLGSPLHAEDHMYAYGGSGIVLSRAAVEALLERETDQHGAYSGGEIFEIEPWVGRLKNGSYGEMILGQALLEKADVHLSGYYPMFHPLNLASLEFSQDNWCVPVISLHKLWSSAEYEALWKWEMGPGDAEPVRFSNLFEFVRGLIEPRRMDWDNFAVDLSRNTSAHHNLDSCRDACFGNATCVQYLYHRLRCYTSATISLGGPSPPAVNAGEGLPMPYVSGWDLEKIDRIRKNETCTEVHWLKASNERHWMP